MLPLVVNPVSAVVLSCLPSNSQFWPRISVSVGRDLPPVKAGSSIRFHTTYQGREIPLTADDSSAGQKTVVEELWREFFSNPSHWWDHRSEKGNPRFPDFKHKKTEEALWIESNLNPSWVEAELAGMAPKSVPSNVYSWNRKLARYCKYGQFDKAIELFQQLQWEGIAPDKFTFVLVLNACATLQNLDEGRRIHNQLIESKWKSDVIVGNSLVNMYAKCGSLDDAWRVFNTMPTRNVVAWSVMIRAYAKCGNGRKALDLFSQMQDEGVEPDSIAYVGVLNACASLSVLEEGRRVHKKIIQSGWESNVFVASSLVNMYAKSGRIEDALKVFTELPNRNRVCWNAIIIGHAECGQGWKALELFQQMQQKGVKPDPFTFVGVLKACGSAGALGMGRHVHKQIIQSNCAHNIFVGSSLVDMYAKNGSIDEAWTVFTNLRTRNVISWNTMILGYVKCGQGQVVLELYRQMKQEGVEPDAVTFVGIVNACANVRSLAEGQNAHDQIMQRGFESHIFVRSSLIDMYATCGSIEDAQRVFEEMPTHNTVDWAALIQGHMKCGHAQKALELFRKMQFEGVKADPATFVAVLKACGSVSKIEEGRNVHKQIIQRGLDFSAFLGNSLIDMYAKCGSLEDAQRVFSKMPNRDVASWNSMLGGYAMHRQSRQVISHFEQMCHNDINLSAVTFIYLLSACSHLGLVDEGLHYFESMASVHNIAATLEHFTCLVELLVQAGRLNQAREIVRNMPCKPDLAVWMSLLGACKVHGDVEMGENIVKQILQLSTGHAAAHALLLDMYAAAGMSDRCAKLQQQILERDGKNSHSAPGLK